MCLPVPVILVIMEAAYTSIVTERGLAVKADLLECGSSRFEMLD